jgi:hypothetical protein
MTSQLLFWSLLGCWALAVVAAAFDVLVADARGARLSAQSLLSAVRICVRYGVVLTSGVIFGTMFETINKIWDLSFKPFSYGVGLICFIMVISLVGRLLDRLLPNDPANRTPTAENGNDSGVANGK